MTSSPVGSDDALGRGPPGPGTGHPTGRPVATSTGIPDGASEHRPRGHRSSPGPVFDDPASGEGVGRWVARYEFVSGRGGHGVQYSTRGDTVARGLLDSQGGVESDLLPALEGEGRRAGSTSRLHGPAVLAANHQSFCDSFFLPLVLRRRVTYVAKAEYFDSWKTAWFFRAAGQIPMQPQWWGRVAACPRHGHRGARQPVNLLGIYPEGTRAPDLRLHRGHTGVARLSLAVRRAGHPGGDHRHPGGPAPGEQADATVPHRDHPVRSAGHLPPRRPRPSSPGSATMRRVGGAGIGERAGQFRRDGPRATSTRPELRCTHRRPDDGHRPALRSGVRRPLRRSGPRRHHHRRGSGAPGTGGLSRVGRRYRDRNNGWARWAAHYRVSVVSMTLDQPHPIS